jgi:hypothetical protein
MKTTLVTNPGFQPFTFSVTVETREEAEIFRMFYTESRALVAELDNNYMGRLDMDLANAMLEAIGLHSNHALSR